MLQKPADDQGDRLAAMERELKRMREATHQESVEQALKQVRSLASKPTVSGTVLVASIENLVDTAMRTGHAQAQAYKMSLRAVAEFEGSPEIRSLVLSLFGDATAKRLTKIVDDWRKTVPKTAPPTSSPSSPSHIASVSPVLAPMQQLQAPPGYLPSPLQHPNYSYPVPPSYYGSPPAYYSSRGGRRGRGRGYSQQQGGQKLACFVCGEGHLARDCPKKFVGQPQA
jgi:hypothetical protein